MIRTGSVLGGEQSGHVIFREHATTGDGILTAVKFLSLAAAERRTVAEFAGAMQRFPQVLLNVPVLDRGGAAANPAVDGAVLEAETALGDRGRVLVRPSGTEPVVRVMVEAEEAHDATRWARRIADVVRDRPD